MLIVHDKLVRVWDLLRPDVLYWTSDQRHDRKQHFRFIPRFTPLDRKGWLSFYSAGDGTFQYPIISFSRTGIRPGTLEIVIEKVIWSKSGCYQTIWCSLSTNCKWHLKLGPYTTLYIPFIKRCALTNRPCLNLLSGDRALILVPSDCKSGLHQSWDLLWKTSLIYFGYTIFITFNIFVYWFYGLCAFVGICCSVFLRKVIDIFWSVSFFIQRLLVGVGMLGSRKPVNHISLYRL